MKWASRYKFIDSECLLWTIPNFVLIGLLWHLSNIISMRKVSVHCTSWHPFFTVVQIWTFVLENEDLRKALITLLARHERKSVLHRNVTGDEKWIYFKKPKGKKSWVNAGEASTSTAKPDRFGKKTLLCVCSDQRGKQLRRNATDKKIINLNNALIKKRREWATRHGKVILLLITAAYSKQKWQQCTTSTTMLYAYTRIVKKH